MEIKNYNNRLDKLRLLSYFLRLKIFLSKRLLIDEDLITENKSVAEIVLLSDIEITHIELYNALEQQFEVDLSEFYENNTMMLIWLSNHISDQKKKE